MVTPFTLLHHLELLLLFVELPMLNTWLLLAAAVEAEMAGEVAVLEVIVLRFLEKVLEVERRQNLR